MKSANKPVIFVVGSTASGKSDWALRLARDFYGVVVNCDSMQVYQQVDIGTAKPTTAERNLRPHFLFDYVAPPNEMTAGEYCRDFFSCVEQVAEGTPIFVVGGTGFYFQAIEKGMYPVIKVSEELKKQVEVEIQRHPEKLHTELEAMDPEYAAKIHKADHYRLGRAIELIRSHQKGVTQIQKEFAEQQKAFPYPLLKLGPVWDREILKQRIRERTHNMLHAGLIDEVQALLDQGLARWAPMQSVGYKETQEFLRGEISEDKLEEEIAISTSQLAKRQRTWFQRDREIHWFPGFDGYEQAKFLVEKFLNP